MQLTCLRQSLTYTDLKPSLHAGVSQGGTLGPIDPEHPLNISTMKRVCAQKRIIDIKHARDGVYQLCSTHRDVATQSN